MTTWGLSPQAEDTDRILSIPGVVVFSGVIAFPSVLAFPSVIGFADFAEAQAAALLLSSRPQTKTFRIQFRAVSTMT
jgi:hypothetical protein